VYSRSRDQCERLAGELKCAYYHARAADNEERLKAWLERGGLIVATSALGTGVDFLGIVFTLHVDIPYGMIDFAQESGRAGRAGEDVDSVVLVEEGKAERQLASGKAAIDESIMCEFVTTAGCRRRVMGLYLDNKETGCADDSSVANCDRCSKGTTAIERVHTKRAMERQTVEETLDEVAGGCIFCFVDSTEEASIDWSYSPEDCEKAEGGKRRSLDERFRRMIRFEEGTHSCFKCGFSQKLCGMGVGKGGKCQWPNTAAAILRGIPSTRQGVAIVKNAGFDGETGNAKEYAKWLGSRHRRRVWGELMSNATTVIIDFIVWRVRARKEAGAEDVQLERVVDLTADIETDDTGVNASSIAEEEEAPVRNEKRRRLGKRMVESITVEGSRGRGHKTAAQAADDASTKAIRLWQNGCIVCRVQGRRTRLQHEWETCRIDVDATEAVR
jgi:hypothetical protein